MSAQQLANHLGRNRKSIDSAIRYARRPGESWLFVIDHDRHIGTRGKPSPIYAVGCFEDDPTPKVDREGTYQRYAEKFKPEEWVIESRKRVAQCRSRKRAKAVVGTWINQLGGKS